MGFTFEGDCAVTTSTLWRLIIGGRIAVTSEDHAQQFGLPKPVDAAQRAKELLTGRVTAVEVSPVTGDLVIEFGHEARLEFLNTSSGYESWHVVSRTEAGTRELVALGGGGLAVVG